MSWVPTGCVAPMLDDLHYLGASRRGTAWSDEYGVIVLAKPTSRRLPQDGSWLELVRWCIASDVPNAGSRQFAAMRRSLEREMPQVTTLVSYSDPSVGHTGALYKASNWWWAPTWHRLRPPPTGNGSWKDGVAQSVKDRWIYPVRRDVSREQFLRIDDNSAVARLRELVSA